LRVSKSLLIALPYLHQISQTRWLWIDQLCINQDDEVERSQQVSIMHGIYGNGKRTLIWLGEHAR
ncbi:HET-domain-containing protein, partial [Bimuria novae-zelandiae CBS 107.79]